LNDDFTVDSNHAGFDEGIRFSTGAYPGIGDVTVEAKGTACLTQRFFVRRRTFSMGTEILSGRTWFALAA
jgi:hypothetical protein